jgi:signal transduction histidine kinase/ActR/RegA family two-component response regulator
MPTGRDASLVCSILERAGISAQECDSPKRLAIAISFGAGAVLIAEEALQDEAVAGLVETVEAQPVWSDLPVILFSSTGRNAETLLHNLGSRINVMVVERPIRITMLVSAVRGALRARERQYQARDLLQRLEEADQQKDLFLATLSHELRTPLNSILGWIQILRGHNGHGVDINRAIDVIERNAKSQAEMISDILFVSRVITGKLELNIEPVAISDVVKSAIDIIRPSAEARAIELNFEDEGVVHVDADTERLQQVFLNLLSNAVKFTPENGRIDVSIDRKESEVRITVADNGQGIDPEFLPYIFERFRQADNTYTRRVGGLGLGLAIVRHLVELHGGKAWAESEGENKGTRFHVSLPIAGAAQMESKSHIQAEPTNGSGPAPMLKDVRILLIEDDDDSRDMLVTVLSFYGAEVETAVTAPEGLEKVREFRPQILISDVGLPKEDGYDLIRKIRSLPAHEGGSVPAIALTGYVSVQDRTAAISAGYQEHMPKPVETEKLVDLINHLLSTETQTQVQV